MSLVPADSMLDLVSPDQRQFLQRKTGNRVPLGVLDLQLGAACSWGREVQNQVLAIEDQWLRDEFSS